MGDVPGCSRGFPHYFTAKHVLHLGERDFREWPNIEPSLFSTFTEVETMRPLLAEQRY